MIGTFIMMSMNSESSLTNDRRYCPFSLNRIASVRPAWISTSDFMPVVSGNRSDFVPSVPAMQAAVPNMTATDRERWTRHRPPDPQVTACAAHERRLARTQLAADEHDVAAHEPGAQLGADRFSLRGSGGFEHAHGH